MIVVRMAPVPGAGDRRLAALVVIAIVLAVTGPHLVSVYDNAVAACKASGGKARPATTRSPTPSTDCRSR